MISGYKPRTYAFVISVLLASCSPASSLDNAAVREAMEKDVAAVYTHGTVTEVLTLEAALAQALRFNLDTRVAEMDELIAAKDVSLERLSLLPSVTAKMQRIGRSNEGGSSSFSVLTGLQSLQPSISTEQHRAAESLNVEWSLLDVVINLGRERAASDRVLIAEERRRKVYHGVIQDTYAAYWRVAAAQSALPIIDNLTRQVDEQITVLDDQAAEGVMPLGDIHQNKATLLDRRKELQDMRQGLAMAELELKTLIDYPLDQPIKLDLSGNDWLATSALPKIKGDLAQFEETALMNRPEVREELLNKQISTRDIKMSILETLPGASLVLTANRDDNKYLTYNSWVDGIASLTQVINKIITAPARISRAKRVDELSDKRRQALVAAVMTQVHVAKARFDFLNDAYNANVVTDKNAQDMLKRASDYKNVGMMSKSALLSVRINSSIAAINKALSYVDVQDSYGRFVTTMGVDLWDADNAGLSVPEFASQIKNNLTDENLFVMTPQPAPVVQDTDPVKLEKQDDEAAVPVAAAQKMEEIAPAAGPPIVMEKDTPVIPVSEKPEVNVSGIEEVINVKSDSSVEPVKFKQPALKERRATAPIMLSTERVWE